MNTKFVFTFFATVFCSASIAHSQSLEWMQTTDPVGLDIAQGVSADGHGHVYISGYSQEPQSPGDAFLSQYDTAGALQWRSTLNIHGFDESDSVSADGMGNAYIAGYTSYGPYGQGIADGFVGKYDSAGVLQWTRVIAGSSSVYPFTSYDSCSDVSADKLGNVYVVGITSGNLAGPTEGGAFLIKYDSNGILQWTRQFGLGNNDYGDSVSADGLGNVYVSGGTRVPGIWEVFLRKYDSEGELQWTRQFGAGNETHSDDVSADGLGNVFVTGSTEGSFEGTNAGASDAFVAKFEADGTHQWTRQFGSDVDDYSRGASADGLGNVYVSGETGGSLDGMPGGDDAFLIKFDSSGTPTWTQQLHTTLFDGSSGVSADEYGTVYISGSTETSLGAGPYGGWEAFVAKFSTAPEPSTLLLASLACAGFFFRQMRYMR